MRRKTKQPVIEKKNTPSKDLEESENPVKKGPSTFSNVDCDQEKGTPSLDIKDTLQQILSALREEKPVKLEVTDLRDNKPNVFIDPPKVDVRPHINVHPALPAPPKIEVRVPTQRIPDFPTPKVEVTNQMNTGGICIALWCMVVLLSFYIGMQAWQLLTLSNFP